MTVSKKVAIYLWVLGGLTVIAGIILPNTVPTGSYSHEGNITLVDEAEYTEFKDWISMDSTQVVSLAIVDEDYPIIAIIDIESDIESSLFGEEVSNITQGYLVFVMIVGSLLFIIPAAFLWDE